MNESPQDIVVGSSKIDFQELTRLTSAFFEDMVKFVVDLSRGGGRGFRTTVSC